MPSTHPIKSPAAIDNKKWCGIFFTYGVTSLQTNRARMYQSENFGNISARLVGRWSTRVYKR